MGYTIYEGDCIQVMRGLPAASVGAVCTDPPYGIGMMGREWDTFAPAAVAKQSARKARKATEPPPGHGHAHANGYIEYDSSPRGMHAFEAWCREWAAECLRVLKPGGHMLAFGSPRAYHRLACGIEDAGFALKDCLMWVHGQGFPKSLDLGDGRGTALKPAFEPVVLAQKPLDGTYAANLVKHGVGCLDIDGCRVATSDVMHGSTRGEMSGAVGSGFGFKADKDPLDYHALGRWPTNLLLTHHPDCNGSCVPGCPVAVLDTQSGYSTSKQSMRGVGLTGSPVYGGGRLDFDTERGHVDSGGASRFYPTFRFEDDDFAPFLYMAKSSRSEREHGLGRLTSATPGERTGRKEGSAGLDSPRAGAGRTNAGANIHPTVKPLQLMRWLVRLITPPGETVIDPFAGSGTTGKAALMEGRDVILIEREAAYLPIIRRRLETTQPGLVLAAD